MKSAKNSYKRKKMYVASLFVLLGLVVYTICNYSEKEVYKIYIDDRLVGVTRESPEIIEETYNEVKAKKYAQGSDIIDENIIISQESILTDEHLVTKDELAKRMYDELEEETVEAISIPQGRLVEKNIPMEVIYVEDSELNVGESRVVYSGKEGVKEFRIQQVTRDDGVVVSRIEENKVVDEAQPKIIARGIKEKPEYIMPVEEYSLSSSFGPRWGRTHEGIDLAVCTGTPVAAAADGVVVQSGWNGGYGISIYVDHGNGVITRYGHLSQAYAQVGRAVKQGEVIGLSGNTGNSTGPHLHFEIRIGDEAVNPASYVNIEY